MRILDSPLLKPRRNELALIPLRDMVVFPHMVVPFFVGRKRSVKAVEEAMGGHRLIFLVTQKAISVEEPGEKDVHAVGTVAKILQMLKLPDGKIRLLVEGVERAMILKYVSKGDMTRVLVKTIREIRDVNAHMAALMRTALKEFKRFNDVYKKIPLEVSAAIESAEVPDRLVDLISANLPLKTDRKLEILAVEDTRERLERCVAVVSAEIEVLELEQQIQNKVRRRMEKTQKDYFLNEQLKEIQKELGNEGDDATGAKELEEKLGAKGLPKEVADKCQKELKRLLRMQPLSPESAVLRTYLEWIADLPWNESTQDHRDIEHARRILDEDHYDLKKVKERILDFIAVRQLKGKVKGPILCFIGPPGTGKTSLGRSVARSLGRAFVRVSLGGVRDEAEIRGHRKTYVGALPGKVIQSMRKAASRNPVFLLDEIDKMSSDFRGDPAAALLEVLDPEQNSTFADHYLEVPYDLSDVMFITTANSAHNIPYPLRDRMEIIEVSGYTEFEKERIAEQFLLPKQVRENGLEWADIRFQKSAILSIIRGYTMEAGVRNLEREIANVLRKIAREAVKKGLIAPAPAEAPAAAAAHPDAAADGDAAPAAVTAASVAGRNPGDDPQTVSGPVDPAVAGGGIPAASGTGIPVASDMVPGAAAEAVAEAAAEAAKKAAEDLAEARGRFRVTVTPRGIGVYLGTVKYIHDSFARQSKPGLAYGLAWTELGGQILAVEVAILEGKGELILTGSLGDVMKESAQAALSFLRAHARELGIGTDFSKDRDIHVHVPEGAIPKDGPSAGITLITALLSAVRKVPPRDGFAMTGEITLTGRLLPIGGVKEKVLAAHRYKMTHVLLPKLNEKDLEDVPQEVRDALIFVSVDSVMDGLAVLFPADGAAGNGRQSPAESGLERRNDGNGAPAPHPADMPLETPQPEAPAL